MTSILRIRTSVGLLLTLALLSYGALHPREARAQTSNAIDYIYDEDHRLVAVVDPAAGTAKYAYDNAGNITKITRQAASVLSVIEFTPNSGAVGSSVTISGTKFAATPALNTVKFGTIVATIVSASTTRIVANVPAGAVTARISVTVGASTASSATNFQVVSGLTPTVTSFTPAVASPGGSVTLSGSNFDVTPTNDKLTLNGTAATVASATATSMTATVPTYATSGKFSLSTPNGVASNATDFFVAPSPYAASAVEYKTRTTMGTVNHFTLSAAGKIALLIFDGVAGNRVYVTFRNVTFGNCTAATLYSPNLQSLIGANICNGSGDFDTKVLPLTGTYTMVIAPPSGGAMDLTVLDVPPDITQTISADGSPATLTINSPGQSGSLTFDGTTGQRVFISYENNTFGCSSLVEVIMPSGYNLYSTYDCDNGYLDTAPLPETGTYTIRWNPGSTLTGSVTFRVYTVPADVTGTITFGGSAQTLTIPNVGQNGSWTFDGVANERSFFRYESNTFGCSVLIEVVKPSGGVWYSTYDCDNGYFDTAPLPETGTYTIRLNPLGSLTGSLSMQIYNVPADTTGSIIIGGPPVTISLTNVGQNGSLTFDGTSGQPVGFTWTNNTFGCSSLVEVAKPSGSVWQGTYDCDNGSFASSPLPETGTYTIRWNPGGAITGSVQLQVTTTGGSAPTQQGPDTSGPSEPMSTPTPTPSPRPTPTPTPSPIPSPSAQTSPSPTPTPSSTATAGQVQAAALAVDEVKFTRSTTPELTQEEMAALWVKGLAPQGPEEWTPDLSKNAWSTERPASPWETLPLRYERPGITALTGRVLALNGGPLANVTLEIGGNTAVTDSLGRFLLSDLQPGAHEMWIDGRTANTKGKSYGTYEAGVDLVGGRTNVLPYTIWMSVLDVHHAVGVSSHSEKQTVVRSPKIPGLEVLIQPGTTITDRAGKTVDKVSITPIPLDRPPYPMDEKFPLFYTLQPGGAYLDKGATVVYPNAGHQPAGTRVQFMYYEADEGWEPYGHGTVTSDGRSVAPDDDVVIYEFKGNSIKYFLLEVLFTIFDALDALARFFGDPVSLGTGLFEYEKTDLLLNDTIPIALTRSYRQLDTRSHAFGIGASHPYEMFLRSSNPYQEADMVFHNGSYIHFARISPGTAKEDAVMEASPTPTPFYKSKLTWNGAGFTVTLRDGSFFRFGEKGALQGAGDRFGNEVTLVYVSGVSGNIAKIRSPNGRWIDFTYDGATNRVKEIKDNLGRKVSYTYDTSGRLDTATDAKGGLTRYTYDAAHQMKTITDARNIQYLVNDYYADGRIQRQTLPDSSTYEFTYTISNGKVTQTDVKDPRGNNHRATFNSEGFLTSETWAIGKAEEQEINYTREPVTNFVTSVTDALNRRTDLGYDVLGNVASVTRLAGTPNAVTTNYTYETKFSQIKTVRDPLNHITQYFYRSNGNLDYVLDPLNHSTTYDFYSGGQLKTITDAKSKTTTFFYDRGDLSRVQDPLGNSVSQFADVAGRVVATKDQLGSVTQFEYDAMNQQTKTVDALGLSTRVEYDANGNVTNVYDQKNNLTQYTYDNFDRVATRKDPLLRTAALEYDSMGNLTTSTDRKGQITRFTYDALNRLTAAKFKETLPGPTYESTISYTLDKGDRLRTIVDSASGTIQRDYDDLDRLSLETTSQGSVSYTYDSDDRPDTMTVTGQPVVDYTFDDADRLTKIVNGTQIVDLAYDELNRRTSLTVPGGVAATYSYDDDSRISGITYTKGASTLGDLGYVYDGAGRRTNVTGAWARTSLPAAVSSMTYNADNQMTARAGVTMTYDNNGNLINDGSSTYTWNARDQLVSTAGLASLNYVYDGLGRRIRKTAGSTATEYVYDRAQVTAEKQAGAFSATLLTGLNLDEVFVRNGSEGSRSLLPDALGSTVALSDAAGTVPTSYTYEPFGKTTTTGTANSNPYQFTGREADSTAFYFFRARYYAGGLGRFISEDPLGFGGGDTNLYAYVGNSPLNATDPSGMCVVGAIIGGVQAMFEKKGFWGVIKQAILGCMLDFAGESIFKAFAFGDEAARGFGELSRAQEFGVQPYGALRAEIRGSGLQSHHLLEKRFARLLGESPSKALSVAVTEGEHRAFTNAWRRAIPYGSGTANATRQQVLDTARQIYADYPEILRALGL
jgi:RHS repeat-associated protein